MTSNLKLYPAAQFRTLQMSKKRSELRLTSQYNSTDLTVGKTIRWTPDLQITYALVEREAFKWFRGEEEIVGENSDSYELTEADLGHNISLQISIINDDVPSTYTAVRVEVPFTSADQSSGAVATALTLDEYDNSISQKLVFDLNADPVRMGAPTPSNLFNIGLTDPLPQMAQSDNRGTLQFSLSGSKVTDVTMTFEDQQGAQSATISNGVVDLSSSTSVANLSISEAAYEADIDLSDVLANLKHIIGLRALEGKSFAAADVNNDNSIDLSDVLAQLKHIIGLRKIDTFDMVDSDGNTITDLQSASSPVEIVLNGDANLSTTLKDNYKSTTNLAPTLTVPTGGTITEDAVGSTITGSLVGADPEQGDLTYVMPGKTATDGAYSVTGTYGTLVLSASTGAYTYTLNNSANAVQALGGSSSETETFSVQVTDGLNTAAAQSLSFTIKGANDAPIIAVSDRNDIAENETNAVVATVSATDAEDSSVTVTLSGNGRDDAAFEVIDGKLQIKSSADYETQDDYQVQLLVTDSEAGSAVRNLEFNVIDAPEAMSGSVVDGYVAGATIFQDLDNDNVLDSNEPYTVTSSTGEFVLSGIVASKTAPLKMISGFDIGTNQPIVTTLGVPTTLSGNAVASPIATLTSISQSENADSNLGDVLGRVASYFDVSATSQGNTNILNDDPITNLTSGDSNTASAAKDVFEANQFIMGLTHISEKAGKYLADQIDTAIQNAGDSTYGAYAGGAVSSYEKLGADAFINTASNHIMTPFAPTSDNAFQINSSQLKWSDYDPTSEVDVINRAEGSTSNGTMSFNGGSIPLNLQNLTNGANR